MTGTRRPDGLDWSVKPTAAERRRIRAALAAPWSLEDARRAVERGYRPERIAEVTSYPERMLRPRA